MGKIRENKSKLYDLESTVMGNKQLIYAERAFIEENRSLILKNYAAAFMGNRQMANQNTDDIFRNRKAILNSLPAGSLVQQNFMGSKLLSGELDEEATPEKNAERIEKNK